MLSAPPDREIKRWPRWLRWIEPHHEGLNGRTLVKCSCGRVMWDKGMPDKVRKHHQGHRMELCQSASVWQFIKMKRGTLEKRTLSEWFLDVMEARS